MVIFLSAFSILFPLVYTSTKASKNYYEVIGKIDDMYPINLKKAEKKGYLKHIIFVTDDGNKYVTTDKNIEKGIKVGDTVSFKVNQNHKNKDTWIAIGKISKKEKEQEPNITEIE